LLALGCRDPVERIREIKERDPNRVQIIEVFTVWWAKHADSPVRVAELDPAVLQVLDPKDTSRQYQARAVSNLAGTRLAGYALERVGAIPNRHKGGAQYRLHYNTPPQGDDPETHPRHPQNRAEPAEKAEETGTNDVRMTPADDPRMSGDAGGHPQGIRNPGNGQDAAEINLLADGSADDADDFPHHSPSRRTLTDVEAAYEELASREAAKPYSQVIADELFLRGASTTAESSQ
jgi:hypothetical protein